MGFNINDFLNAESRKDIKNGWKPVKVNVRKLRPASGRTNFYHADDREIKELAESIELIGLQQYPVIRPIEGTGEYEVIAGHKRRLAILRLLDEGKNEYEEIPCKVETPDDIQNELILIFTNSTQRERTDYEKMREIERVRELLAEYQKTHELTGRKQNIIAEILGTSKTKVGTLDNIKNNLIAPFVEEFAAGKIRTSAANEIAGLEPDAQQALYETYKETGSLIAKDVKSMKGQQEPGQEKPGAGGHMTHEGMAAGNGTGAQEKQGQEGRECRKYPGFTCNIEETVKKHFTRNGNIEGCAGCCGICMEKGHCKHVCEPVAAQIAEKQESDWRQAHPESITSLCYSCKRYMECNVKTGTCRKCDRYASKAEAEKTEGQRYSEEQDRIDQETKKKLREIQQDEKMNSLPSEGGKKIHQIRLSPKYFDDVESGRKSFELQKNDRGYKVGDVLELLEFKEGRHTGRAMGAEVTYFLDGFAGLEDGYCILGIAPLETGSGGNGHGNDRK